MKPTKIGTVALLVRFKNDLPELMDTVSSETEIALLEAALTAGVPAPIEALYRERDRIRKEDEEFGNYIEELLSQPFVRPEIQEHGVRWLASKNKIEEFEKSEREATRVIADYAYKIFKECPWRLDFFLAGPTAKVRIKVFVLTEAQLPNSQAA